MRFILFFSLTLHRIVKLSSSVKEFFPSLIKASFITAWLKAVKFMIFINKFLVLFVNIKMTSVKEF